MVAQHLTEAVDVVPCRALRQRHAAALCPLRDIRCLAGHTQKSPANLVIAVECVIVEQLSLQHLLFPLGAGEEVSTLLHNETHLNTSCWRDVPQPARSPAMHPLAPSPTCVSG